MQSSNGSNCYVEWRAGDLDVMRVDEEKTRLRKKQLEEKQLAKEQLLKGKSESFRAQFKNQIANMGEEDPQVWSSNLSIVCGDVATLVERRRSVTVLVYGHEKSGKSRTADKVVASTLHLLQQVIDSAANHHERKLSNLEKEKRKKELEEELRLQQEREDAEAAKEAQIAAGTAVAAARGMNSARKSKVVLPPPTPGDTAKKSLSPTASSKRGSGKRVSLMKRQSISAEVSNKMHGILPPPVLDKIDLSKGLGSRTTTPNNFTAEPAFVPFETLPESVKLPPITHDATPKSQQRASKRLTRTKVDGDDTARKRRSSIGMTSLSRNGLKGVITGLSFDRVSTHVKLPPLVKLPQWVQCSEIEFWVRSREKDHQMTVVWVGDGNAASLIKISLNTDENMEHCEGVLLFMLRDQYSSTYIATCGTEDLCNDKWHHVSFRIVNPAENIITLTVDNRTVRMSIKTAENPKDFGDWTQNGLVGGEYVGRSKVDHFLKGEILDLKFWSFEGTDDGPATLQAHYSFTDSDATTGTLTDLTGGQGAEVFFPEWGMIEFPETCLHFNGAFTHINTGTLGDFGQLMGSCRVEFWLRSGCTDRSMAVLRVTDTSHKHAVIGVELNKGADGNFRRGCTCFTIRDTQGKELVAVQTITDLCDGKWHQVTWDVVCSENVMSVKIDKFDVSLDYSKAEQPSSFCSLTQWVPIGAHNHRGTLQDHFEGYLKEVKICGGGVGSIQQVVAQWQLDEGVGATVVMDKTGNGNNGIIYDRNMKKKSSRWYSVKQPEGLVLAVPMLGSPRANINLEHSCNEVQISAVHIIPTASEPGLYTETIIDLIDGGNDLKLEDSTANPYGRGVHPQKLMKYVAKHTFKAVQSCAHAQQLVEQANKHTDPKSLGTRIFTLLIGEGRLTVVDLASFSQKTRSVWDSTLEDWVEPKTLISQDDKAVNFCNKKASATERTIMKFGKSPALFRRSKAGMETVDFSETLTTQLLQYSLLRDMESFLTFVHMLKDTPTAAEQKCTEWFVKGFCGATQSFACGVVQKAVRVFLAKKKISAIKQSKEENEEGRRRIIKLQEAHPELLCVRDSKIVLLVDVTRLQDERMPHLHSAGQRCKELEDNYARQGWEVRVLAKADASLRSIIDNVGLLQGYLGTSFIMVHYVGYAAYSAPYHKWMERSELHELTKTAEEAAREEVMQTEARTRTAMQHGMADEEEETRAAEAIRISEDKELRKEMRRKELEAKMEAKRASQQKSSGWVMSTKVEPKHSEKAKSQQQQDNKWEIEEARRMKTPLPFEPSPTPIMEPLPDEVQWSPEEHQFLTAYDTPVEYSSSNTLPFSALRECLLKEELGKHVIIAAECYPAPNTTSPAWAWLGASTGEVQEWTGKGAPEYLGYYLNKALCGGGALDVTGLCKSEERKKREEDVRKLHESEVEAALSAGRPVPIDSFSKEGVAWPGFAKYISSGMRKRDITSSNTVEGSTYVGDMLIADKNMRTLRSIPQRRQAKEKQAAAIATAYISLNTTLPELSNDEIPDMIADRMNEVQGIRQRVAHRPVHRKLVIVLRFNGDIVKAGLPWCSTLDWEDYVAELTGGKQKMSYIVQCEDKGSFSLHITLHEDEHAIVTSIATKFRAKLGLEFRPAQLSNEVVLTPCAAGLLYCTGIACSLYSIMAVKKAFLSGSQSDEEFRLVIFDIASQDEHVHMNDERKTILQKRKQEVARLREENMTEDEKRKRQVEETRKSLRSM